MKFKLTLLIILLAMISCKEKSANKDNAGNTDTEKLSMGDMPNKQTKYDTIYTVDSPDNTNLINDLKAKLEKANFTFEERKNRGGFSYNNCEENRQTITVGNGIREYFARSTKPEKGTKDFYPDFQILVYEFPTEQVAKLNFEKIEKALNSAGNNCNGKSPEKVVYNGKEVFHLGTRAEMFRTYIEKYGEFIKNYH